MAAAEGFGAVAGVAEGVVAESIGDEDGEASPLDQVDIAFARQFSLWVKETFKIHLWSR